MVFTEHAHPQVVETVLSYLQLRDCLPDTPAFIAPLPDMRSTLILAFHKTSPETLAESSPFIQALLGLAKQRMGKYTVGIPELARALDYSFEQASRVRLSFRRPDCSFYLSQVQEALQAHSAAGEVSFVLDNLALCFKARMHGSGRCIAHALRQVLRVPESIADLSAALAARLGAAERCQVGKLDAIYNVASGASALPTAAEQEALLRRDMQAYLDDSDAIAAVDAPSVVRKLSIEACSTHDTHIGRS